MKIKTDLTTAKKGDYVKFNGAIHKIFKVVDGKFWLRKIKDE